MAETAGLAITFVEVSEDSRCPKEVECVWAGQAIIVVNAAKGGEDLGDFSLALNSDREELAIAVVAGYWVKFVSLDPYPVSDRKTQPEEYIASLIVAEK